MRGEVVLRHGPLRAPEQWSSKCAQVLEGLGGLQPQPEKEHVSLMAPPRIRSPHRRAGRRSEPKGHSGQRRRARKGSRRRHQRMRAFCPNPASGSQVTGVRRGPVICLQRRWRWFKAGRTCCFQPASPVQAALTSSSHSGCGQQVPALPQRPGPR